MKLDATAEFTLGLIAKLHAGQELSTAEVREVLQRANVHYLVIDYIADLHTNKVEGKNYGHTISKRSIQKIVAYNAVYDEIEEAEKPIKLSTAITRAAKTTGMDRKTLKRHLEQSSRKR